MDEWNEIDPKGKELSGAAIGDARIIWRSMRLLKKKKIDKAVFNTAQGGHVRNACLFSLFNKVEFIGVIHTIRKFQGSFTQHLINWKIKKYFVLGEFLASTALSHQSRSKIQSFYPLDFPKGDYEIERDDKLHISIIGSVESRRKDLNGFVSLVEQSDESFHFHFLGKADPTNEDVIKLKENLKRIECENRVELYENRVEFQKMDEILRKSIAILPLVHPNTPSADEYFSNQIPGGMSVALGYQIPLLMHVFFGTIQELQPASIYYSLENFSEALEQLQSEGETIRKRMNQYSSEEQYKKYLEFIFG